MRAWVGVVSLDHLRRGLAGGFVQVCHGKAAPLRRMAPGDLLLMYSPRTAMGSGDPVQAFTALGRVTADPVVQVEMAPDFHPFRRNVDWLPARPAPIRPLLGELSFTRDNPGWGMILRRGHFEIPVADARRIAEAMGPGLGLPLEGSRPGELGLTDGPG